MAGISAFYYVGQSGGFLGSDGLISADFIIEVWEGDRKTFVVKYKTYNYRPIGLSLEKFVPAGPNDPNMERTAMILFASNLFASCPSFNKVVEECEGVDFIDFNTGRNVPKHFDDLLEESESIDISDKVDIYRASLDSVKI